MARKEARKQNKRLLLSFLGIFPHPSTIIIFLGFLLIIVSFVIRAHADAQLSFKGSFENSSSSQDKIYPVKVIIPKIDTSLPVYKTKILNGNWEVANNGASYLENSSGINEKYSVIVYDHNTKGNFDRLSELRVSDTIILEGSDKKIHVYRVRETKIVDPSDISILTEDSSKNLILYTCYGFADLKRFVVKAIPTS